MTGPQRRDPGSPEQWGAMDQWLEERFTGHDGILEAAQRTADEAGLPQIQVTPTAGKFLQLLARSVSARSILEIGTLGGYSTIWLARGLPPGGKLTTLEFEPKHAAVAHKNLKRADLDKLVTVIVGNAEHTLPGLEGKAQFDFTFIDADKPRTPIYFQWALKLSRPGALIVVDNVVRGGATARGDDADARGMQEALDLMAGEPRVVSTAIQTVGSKGWDGFAIALVR